MAKGREAQLFADPAQVTQRLARLDEPHVKPLNDFVRRLRKRRGGEDTVPWFDPSLAGVNARILALHEAPGARAVGTPGLRSKTGSGIISPDNYDDTAVNFSALTAEAGWSRDMYVAWNVVPWYLGDTRTIAAATEADVNEAFSALRALMKLLPNLLVVVTMGRAAQIGWGKYLVRESTRLVSVPCVHPSPRSLNRYPDARPRALAALRVAKAVVALAFDEPSNDRSAAVVSDVEQEDWIKTRSWDLPTDFKALLNTLGVYGMSEATQAKAIRHLMTLPAWRPAPPQIKAAAEELLRRDP